MLYIVHMYVYVFRTCSSSLRFNFYVYFWSGYIERYDIKDDLIFALFLIRNWIGLSFSELNSLIYRPCWSRLGQNDCMLLIQCSSVSFLHIIQVVKLNVKFSLASPFISFLFSSHCITLLRFVIGNIIFPRFFIRCNVLIFTCAGV